MSKQVHPLPEDIMAAFDGETGPSERGSILRHAESCPTCRELIDRFSSARQSVHTIEGVDLPNSFARSTARAVQARMESEAGWDAIERTAQRVLAALIVVAALLFAFQPDDADASSEAQQGPAGLINVYIQDTTVARVATIPHLTRDDILAAALTPPD